MDSITAMKQVVEETSRVVNAIRPDQLGLPTLCTEWTVRDILNHITGGATMFAECVENGFVADERLGQLMGGDNLGDDYKAAFAVATGRAMSAFDAPDVAEKMVKLPFGEMPAGVAINIAVFDVTTHAADLAMATGQQIDNTELLETALAVGRQMVGPPMRDGVIFQDERPAGDDAPAITRLLAFAGRNV